jgi:hypothetical protein
MCVATELRGLVGHERSDLRLLRLRASRLAIFGVDAEVIMSATSASARGLFLR